MADYKDRIRAFISRSLRNQEFDDDQDIFSAGFVNSLFAMQLVMFVEKEFSINVDDQDLDIDNFRSINAIDRFIRRKQASHAPVEE